VTTQPVRIERVGIVGYGMIAKIHAAALRQMPNVQIVGVMDRGSGQGRVIAPEADAGGNNSLEAFMARDDLDWVTVATPSGVHLDAALLAARFGKHCIVEKPIEISLPRIDQMIAAHESAGTTLGGIFNNRYTQGAQLLKRTAEKGRFGRITFASAVGPWWRDPSYYGESNWKGRWALDGGGALMNQGIHSVDLLQWIVGEPVVRVSGSARTLVHDIEVEDTATAQLEFQSGALGTLACTTSMWPGHFRTLTLAGTHGTAVLADGNLLFWAFREPDSVDDAQAAALTALPGIGVGASNPSAGVDAGGHLQAFEAFAEAVRDRSTPSVDGYEARKAIAIIRAVYESSEQGGAPVTL
jgi:UDP-N-acetyl-2-amino-2-deoxyglucuronate dehydrogenase